MGRNSLQRNKAKVTNTTGCIMILKIPPNVPHTNTNAISAIDTIPDMANIWLISGIIFLTVIVLVSHVVANVNMPAMTESSKYWFPIMKSIPVTGKMSAKAINNTPRQPRKLNTMLLT
ncbi:hypothetical protein NXW25_28215 (plasmid) [Bacteroides ovatus]|nr:hypothetical protein [Bacteroides ovatus]